MLWVNRKDKGEKGHITGFCGHLTYVETLWKVLKWWPYSIQSDPIETFWVGYYSPSLLIPLTLWFLFVANYGGSVTLLNKNFTADLNDSNSQRYQQLTQEGCDMVG